MSEKFQEDMKSMDRVYRKLCKHLGEGEGWVSYQLILPKTKSDTTFWFEGSSLNGSSIKNLDCSEFEVARIATAFSNEQRVHLMKAIYEGHHTFSDLKEKTGMKPGQLQHHLKELALTSYLLETSKRNHYELSSYGKGLLFLMLCISKMPPHRGEGQEFFLSPDKVGAVDAV